MDARGLVPFASGGRICLCPTLRPSQVMRVSLFFLALLALAPLGAFAQTPQLIGSPALASGWSGSGHDATEDLVAPGILQAIEMGERNDDPCFLRATFARPVGTNQSEAITRTLDLCGSNGPTSRSLKRVGSYSALNSGPSGIRALVACGNGNSRNPKMKGIRLAVYDIQGEGSDTGSKFSHGLSFERPNSEACQYFSASSSRPQGQVSCENEDEFITGLRIGINTKSNSIASLRPFCRRVEIPAPPAPAAPGGVTAGAPAPAQTGTPTGSPTPMTIPGGTTAVTLPGSSSFGVRYTTVGPVSTRSLAGGGGSGLTVLSGQANEFLYALQFGERGNEPCFVRAYWARASDGRANVQTRTSTFNQCGGSVSGMETIGEQTSEVSSAGGHLKGVYAVRVTTNNRNGNNLKLKGAAVDFGLVGSPGPDWSESDGFSRPNARPFTTEESACSSRQSVVALELHHNTVGSRKAVTGIAVRCRRIQAND